MTHLKREDTDEVVEEIFKVLNEKGLHARAAGKVIAIAKNFDAYVTFERGGLEINAKSILEMMTLSASRGTLITVRAWGGADAKELVQTIGELFHDRFGEEA